MKRIVHAGLSVLVVAVIGVPWAFAQDACTRELLDAVPTHAVDERARFQPSSARANGAPADDARRKDCCWSTARAVAHREATRRPRMKAAAAAWAMAAWGLAIAPTTAGASR